MRFLQPGAGRPAAGAAALQMGAAAGIRGGGGDWEKRLEAGAGPGGRAPRQCARASAAGGCAPRCVRERGRYAWSCPRGGSVIASTGEVGKDLPLKPPVQPVCWDLMMSPPPSA